MSIHIPKPGTCKGKATIKDISEDPLLGMLESALEEAEKHQDTRQGAIVVEHLESAIQAHKSH